jgi:hypothetical protein
VAVVRRGGRAGPAAGISPLETHYAALAVALGPLPARRRRRILAEAADHLAEAAAAHEARGLARAAAERAAVTAFGPAHAVARAHAEVLAAPPVRRAAVLAAPAVLALGLLVALTSGRPVSGPGDAVAFVAAQVAAAAWLVTAVRLARHHHACRLPAGAARLLARGAGTTAVAAAAGALAEAAALVAAPGGAPPAALAAAGAVTGLALLAAAALAGARAPLAVAAALGPAPAPDLVDDARVVLARAAVRAHGRRALVPVLEGAYRAGRVVAGLAAAAGLDARRRPWRCAAVAAAAAGFGVALGHAVGEGVTRVGPALAAGGVLLAVEAVAALAGFAVLGRWLGLRR